MNASLINLRGSESRDTFKQLHKSRLGDGFYACDLDFVLIQKTPVPDIVAALDYKRQGDKVSFSEVIAYNALVRRGISVFIVTGDADLGQFNIQKYIGGHHFKPTSRLVDVTTVSNWGEFKAWEDSLRWEFQSRFSA